MPNRDRKKQKKETSDAVSIVDELLKKAIKCSASDIHFEPTAKALVVKYRLDGILQEIEKLPKPFIDSVIARLKVLGNLLTYRTDIPQEGRIEIDNKAQNVIDQRLAVFPTIYGQRAVVRIFYSHLELTELGQLGFSENLFQSLTQIAEQTQGILLLTGPAGSGKSTTLAALLRYILKNQSGRSIVTIEDPVEIRIDGATQTQITPHGQLTFPVALRSLLRQDPQVVMIGEIRDAETAKIAIEAGLTGHLLMSTMHSGTPSGALLRLLEMGIEPYQVTSSVCAVLNQRLVRRLCEKCKKQNKETSMFEPVGCEQCFNTGFHGRALIAELVQLDGQLRKAVLKKFDLEQLEQIIQKRGHMSIRQHGNQLVNKGITTLDELNKICQPND
ncbi:MAG: GspE/PulE family protein [Planctomycetota bacterium]|jgi:type II secretory ATPase GspE/PulE/Tfp pilus assembly ATPase PilB-like protein